MRWKRNENRNKSIWYHFKATKMFLFFLSSRTHSRNLFLRITLHCIKMYFKYCSRSAAEHCFTWSLNICRRRANEPMRFLLPGRCFSWLNYCKNLQLIPFIMLNFRQFRSTCCDAGLTIACRRCHSGWDDACIWLPFCHLHMQICRRIVQA